MDEAGAAIAGVVFCPMAPVLVPEVARNAAPELDALRAACRQAIRSVAGGNRQLVLVGPAESARVFGPQARGSLAGLGIPLEIALSSAAADGTAELPLSLTVGAWLVRDALGSVDDAVFVAVGAGGEATGRWTSDRDVTLVVLGDGSARRGVKAPGYLDERAAAFDAQLDSALRSGDPDALAALDAVLGAELLAAGMPAWQAVAPVLRGREWDARLWWTGDPYGVSYLVASWECR